MSGRPLATNAVAAAAVAFRAPDDFSVVSFARRRGRRQVAGRRRPVGPVVDGVLALRGHGTTDLAGALHAAGQQLARSSAGRKITVLLSDCRATEPGDATAAASALDELAIIAPAGDDDEATELARAVGRLDHVRRRADRRRRGGHPGAAVAGVSRCVARRDDAERVLLRGRRRRRRLSPATWTSVARSLAGRGVVRAGRPTGGGRRVVVEANTCVGASASEVSPRNIASTACMFSPSICGSSTDAPLTSRGVASIWYVRMPAGFDVVEHAGELEQLRRRQAAVGDDVLGRRLDQAAGDARVERSLGEHAGQRAAEEVLLAGDAPEVGRRVLLPVAAARRIFVLVVARADVGEGVLAVELEAPGRRDVEPGVRVAGRVLGTARRRRRRRRPAS